MQADDHLQEVSERLNLTIHPWQGAGGITREQLSPLSPRQQQMAHQH